MSHILGGKLNANDNNIINVGDPFLQQDAVNLRTLNDYVNTAVYCPYIAGEDIPSFTVVALYNNLLYKADRTNMNHLHNVIGLTLTSVTTGNVVNTIKEGVTGFLGWGLIAGNHYFLSDIPGQLTITKPISTGFNQIIGFSQNSNALLVLQREPILTE